MAKIVEIKVKVLPVPVSIFDGKMFLLLLFDAVDGLIYGIGLMLQCFNLDFKLSCRHNANIVNCKK